jgi:hypothetical protein
MATKNIFAIKWGFLINILKKRFKMKVYVIYDKESWGVLGVDKIFSTYEKAKEYLKKTYNYIDFEKFKNKYNFKHFDQFCKNEIFEIEVED